MKKGIISILALSLAITSCNKDTDSSNGASFGGVTSIEDLNVPSSFNWSSAKEVMSDISVAGIDGVYKSQVRIDIYDVDPYVGGTVLYSGFTNTQGRLEVPVKVAGGLKEVVVVANTVGVGNNRITASVSGSTITAHFSGVPQARKFDKNSAAGTTPTTATNFGGSVFGDNVYYLGGFNGDGVPSGMGSVSITQAYLDALALTLPEANHLPCDPVRKNLLADLFCNQVTTSKDDAEVYITFLAEGAGYENALAYYYYPAGSAPATPGDVDSVFIIIPNATANATGMQAGDRIKLGTFPKNTTIEWVLLSDMWDDSNSRVGYEHTPGKNKIFFGENGFNSDMGVSGVGCTDPTFNQHMISLTDVIDGEDAQIFSFEDIHYPFGDYDFNDCIFYATGDLYPSCAPQAKMPSGAVVDTDKDGIIDQYDDEPNNPDVACLIEWDGTLVFEDLWPAKGDYDFNDLVNRYNIIHAINASGEVHEVRANYTIEAAGAGFNNGFGTKLSDDLAKADIASIVGRTSTGNFPMDGDLTASPDPTDLVMYNWDKTKDLIVNDINGGAFFNTLIGGGKGNAVTENIVITFNAGVAPWQLGLPPYNTFIFANQDQTREIHLADMEESGLHADARFGTADDDSNPGIGRYFKTVAPSNLPWALDIPSSTFAWPLERVDILTAYPDFGAWAMSGGVVNPTWYDNPAAGQTYP